MVTLYLCINEVDDKLPGLVVGADRHDGAELQADTEPKEDLYSVMQSDGNSFCGDVVLDKNYSHMIRNAVYDKVNLSNNPICQSKLIQGKQSHGNWILSLHSSS